MTRWLRRHPYWAVGTGFAMGLLVAVGVLIGSLVTRVVDQPAYPPELLQAASSDSGEMFAMATGLIASGFEGVFYLDFLTGDLRGWVINERTRQLGGVFHCNVINDLGVVQGKKQKYLLVTGMAPMTRGSTGVRPADCIVYVADANTGNFAAYQIPFNRNAWASGNAQAWQMTLLHKGSARNLNLGGP